MDIKAIIIIIFVLLSVAGTIGFIISSYAKKNERIKYYQAAENIIKEKFLKLSLLNPNIQSVRMDDIYNINTMLYIKNMSVKPKKGFVFDVDDKVTIGRNKNNKIILNDITVSGTHCTIFRYEGIIYLQDNSLNGTTVKRGLLKSVFVDEICQLEDGDELIVGNTIFKLKLFEYDGRCI